MVFRDPVMEEELHRRVFRMLEDEVLNTYRYVEPEQMNLKTYSLEFYRLHQDICRQVDSLFKLLLKECEMWPVDEKGVAFEEKRVKFDHYFGYVERLELGSIELKLAIRDWRFFPFMEWQKGKAPRWWTLHNRLKHRFGECFEEANYLVVWMSLAAFYVLLGAGEKVRPGSRNSPRKLGPVETRVFYPYW